MYVVSRSTGSICSQFVGVFFFGVVNDYDSSQLTSEDHDSASED